MAKFAVVPFSVCSKIGSWSAGTYCSRHARADLQIKIERAQAAVVEAKLRVLRLGIEKSNLVIRDKILEGMGVKFDTTRKE